MRAIAMVVALGACAHNVPQDLATGKDGKIAGATPIALDNNEGRAAGIVTYPGGDRVDWRSIELPAGKHGKLALKLTYTTPRPGLTVAFDVFDEYRAPLVKAAYQKHGHTREAQVDNAKGTYFVRVYAPKRGDAGKYKLVADFTEDAPPPPIPTIAIPDPPRLADVPPPDVPCDPFDAKNDACKAHCDASAQATWPGCAKECPDPMDPASAKFPACKKIMKCGAAPDPRIADCNKPLPPPPPAKPITGRVIKAEIDGADVIVWITVGSANGVDKSWTAGTVLRNGTQTPLVGGAATVLQVNKTTTKLRVHLTKDVISANDEIRVGP